jgi:hypothetical protein
MAYKPVVFNNIREGLRLDTESFILPPGASPNLLNMTYFRGRVVEKGGEELFCENLDAGFRARLGARTFSGTTDSSGNIASGTQFLNGATSPNTILITQGSLNAIDNGTGTFVDFQSSGWSGTGTISYSNTTTTSTITGFAPSTAYDVYMIREVDQYSPGMGIAIREIDIVNEQELFAFDRLKPYRFSAFFDRFQLQDNYSDSTATFTYSGSDTNFFFTTNYQGGFWATNDVYGFDGRQDVTACTTGSTTTITFTGTHTFQVNDWVFLWDFVGVTFTTNSGQVTVVGSPNEITVNVVSSGTYTGRGTVESITRQMGTGDGIKWYDPSGWHNFYPPLTGQNPPVASAAAVFLLGALMIFPYKGFLVTLNTWEGNSYTNAVNFQQRARWSQNGTVYFSGPVNTPQMVDPLSWLQITGRGGYLDAPTQQSIVSAAYIRDTLVVFFESSTWVLDFTNDLFLPFRWVQVNADYGSQGTFGTITFDKAVFTVSTDGFIASDGINLERIDQKIPDTVYTINKVGNNSQRIAGILNFVGQNIKWAYANSNVTYPNLELVYDLLDKSWSMNEGFHTCFCKYERFFNLTWAEARFTWASANFAWDSFDDEQGDTITLGVNAQGFVHEIPTEQITDQSYNDPQYRVTAVNSSGQIIVPNHSFTSNQFLYLTSMSSPNDIYNDAVYKIQVIDDQTLQLLTLNSERILVDVILSTQAIASGYVAQINNIIFQSKRFYAGNEVGLQCRLGYIDFLFNPFSTNINMTVELYIDEFQTPSQVTSFNLQGIPGSTQAKIMKRVYFNSSGTAFSFKLYYADIDMFNFSYGDKQFVLHQFTPYIATTGRIIRQPLI